MIDLLETFICYMKKACKGAEVAFQFIGDTFLALVSKMVLYRGPGVLKNSAQLNLKLLVLY